jgi:hypothetical protein
MVIASGWMISSFIVYYSLNAIFAVHTQQDLLFTPAHWLPGRLTSLLALIASDIWDFLTDRVGVPVSPPSSFCGMIGRDPAMLALCAGRPRGSMRSGRMSRALRDR